MRRKGTSTFEFEGKSMGIETTIQNFTMEGRSLQNKC